MVPLEGAGPLDIIRITFPDFFVVAMALSSYLILRKIRAQKHGSHGGSQETQLIRDGGGATETFLTSSTQEMFFVFF